MTLRLDYSYHLVNVFLTGFLALSLNHDPDHIEAYCNYVPEIIDYRSIGERVQELRKEKKLIQKDLEGDLQEK